MLVLGAHPEPRTSPDILLPGERLGRRLVYAGVQQVQALLILAVEAADIGARPVGLDHHGDAVQLVMPRMEDVACQGGRLPQTVAAQKRSNAEVRSAAIDCGVRPSIW